MSQLDKNIAVNLKHIRKSKNMSLDMLASKTGVSKSMLGQIERGESNPTVATIGKIVEGIRIPFEELIGEPKSQVSIIEKTSVDGKSQAGEDCKVYMFFPYEEKRRFEGYVIEINPGGIYDSDRVGAMQEATAEYINVFAGELTLEINNYRYKVATGDAVKFATQRGYHLLNEGNEKLVMNVTFSWF